MIMNSSIRTSFKGTSRIANSRRCGRPPSFHRAYSIPIFANESESKGLDQWLASPPTHTFKDPVSVEHLHDLYITLPTRDGTRRPFVKPEVGMPLPAGHHLAFFHARLPEPDLRKDGTDSEISPPQPFTKRMWAAGKITWNAKNPLVVGVAATGKSGVSNVVRKKWDEGKPMLFVTQRIEFSQDGMDAPAIVEERAHVYFHAKIIENHKKIFDRPGMKHSLENCLSLTHTLLAVKDIPSSVDFSLKYTPTPVTLFRYSALMFNAHHIHLDKEYCEKEEKYPGKYDTIYPPI